MSLLHEFTDPVILQFENPSSHLQSQVYRTKYNRNPTQVFIVCMKRGGIPRDRNQSVSETARLPGTDIRVSRGNLPACKLKYFVLDHRDKSLGPGKGERCEVTPTQILEIRRAVHSIDTHWKGRRTHRHRGRRARAGTKVPGAHSQREPPSRLYLDLKLHVLFDLGNLLS